MTTMQQWPARRCTGPCDQGRRECPCPNACETEEPEREPMTRRDFWAVGLLFVFCWAMAFAAFVVVASS